MQCYTLHEQTTAVFLRLSFSVPVDLSSPNLTLVDLLSRPVSPSHIPSSIPSPGRARPSPGPAKPSPGPPGPSPKLVRRSPELSPKPSPNPAD